MGNKNAMRRIGSRRLAGTPGSAADITASLQSACLLLALVFGFVGLLSFGRRLLAVQIVPGLSVYVGVMIALTLAIWTLSWIYMRRLRLLEQDRVGQGDA